MQHNWCPCKDRDPAGRRLHGDAAEMGVTLPHAQGHLRLLGAATGRKGPPGEGGAPPAP